MWQTWIIIAGFCFIIEIATVGFLVFWFGIGALIAMIVSLFTTNIAIQMAAFVVSSTILIFFTRKFANKISKNDENIKTNAYSIIGKKGLVIKDINPESGEGQVKVGTEVWSAKSANDVKIEKGTEVEVIEVLNDWVKIKTADGKEGWINATQNEITTNNETTNNNFFINLKILKSPAQVTRLIIPFLDIQKVEPVFLHVPYVAAWTPSIIGK